MSRFVFVVILCSLLIGVILAKPTEKYVIMDACNGAMVVCQIYNDSTAAAGHPAGSRPTGPEDLSGCPAAWEGTWTPSDFADTLEQCFFPDTLPRVFEVDSIVEFPIRVGPDTTFTQKVDEYWYESGPPESIWVPPLAKDDCCQNGIYAKLRMKDMTTGYYSLWNDIQSSLVITGDQDGYTLLMFNLTFKYIQGDEIKDLIYDCADGDSVFLYVWDCNESDLANTFGEFAALDTAFASVPQPTVPESVYLYNYDVKRDTSGTQIAGGTGKLPRQFFVMQNEPNPFNAMTVIQYGLTVDTEVEIYFTNLLGQRVATLVNEFKTAGYHKAVWDGTDYMGRELPSGVYFYTFRAGSYTEKKRAILMK